MLNKHILVVDDEPHIREVVQYALTREGSKVTLASNARDAARALSSEAIDLIVLDIMLPDESGLDLCRQYRAKHDVPIVFLSARGEEMDRVLGLEMGADDYLTKPFGTRELIARIKAVLRRSGPATPEPTREHDADRLAIGPLVLDIERHEVRVSGHPVILTHMEFLLLKCLMRRPGVVFERTQLIVESRTDETHITERTIDTHIRRIRAKLREHGLAPIVTVHGVGYKLDVQACSSA